MANLGSLVLGIGIVTGIGALSHILKQNKSRQFNDNDFIASIKLVDFNFSPSLITLSQDARAGIALDQNNNVFIGRSIGDEFAIRKMKIETISHEFGFVNFKFNDFTFPNFNAKFDPNILEAINAKLHTA